jgi:hypothetical protein
MDNTSRIGKILQAIDEAQGLLNEFITPELESKMTVEQKAELEECRKLTGKDLKNSSEILQKINLKYKKNA